MLFQEVIEWYGGQLIYFSISRICRTLVGMRITACKLLDSSISSSKDKLDLLAGFSSNALVGNYTRAIFFKFNEKFWIRFDTNSFPAEFFLKQLWII